MTFEPAPNSPERKPINPFLQFVLELGPLGVFFFANARGEMLAALFPALAMLGGPLFVATALCIVATLIALVTSFVLTRRLPIMPFVTCIVVVIFGGLAQAHLPLGHLLLRACRAERDRLAQRLDQFVGRLQGVRHHAAHLRLRA